MIATNDKYAQANSKSGHKNISYQRQRDAYVINVMRKGYIFVTLCKSVEEAIDVRDLVYEFFYKNDRLPSIEEMGLKNGSVLKAKIKSKHNDRESNYTCKICNRRFHYNDERLNGKNSASAFKERGNICGHCARQTNAPLSKARSDNQSKHKYISCFDRLGRTYYRVKIKKNRSIMNRSFNNLDQAIRFRNKAVEFYNNNGRLPTHEEQNIIFPGRLTYKKNTTYKDNSKKSKHSSTGLKHISYDKLKDRYITTVVRDDHTAIATFKDLDDAIAARDIILAEYDKTGSLPSRGEILAKLDKLKNHSQE